MKTTLNFAVFFRLFCHLPVSKKPVKSLIKAALSNVHDFNKDCDLRMVRILMRVFGLNKKKFQTQPHPEKLAPGQLFLINDGFIKAIVVIKKVIDSRVIKTNIVIPLSRSPKMLKSSIGYVSIFNNDYNLFFAPQQLQSFAFIGKIEKMPVEDSRRNYAHLLDYLTNYYNYIRLLHCPSVAYICGETENIN